MSLSHHGDDQFDKMQRLIDQINGTARREYPRGRMGAEDDGSLSYMMSSDTARSTIIIRFGKPVEWIGLGIEDAEHLRDELDKRLLELRGISV